MHNHKLNVSEIEVFNKCLKAYHLIGGICHSPIVNSTLDLL